MQVDPLDKGEKQPPPAPSEPPRQWSSKELLDGHTEAIIVHAGEIYRLRCTRNNKLILHK